MKSAVAQRPEQRRKIERSLPDRQTIVLFSMVAQMQMHDLREGSLELRPLVFVPALGTCFWESSCASGTTAVGIYLAEHGRAVSEMAVHEPGGDLDITFSDGRIILGGVVNIM